MATFPRAEAEIVELTQSVISGLGENQEVYPAPTVPLDNLKKVMDQFNSARVNAIAAQAAAEAATSSKAKALKKLVDCLKSNIRYAENVTSHKDDKLKLIGWGGRKTPRNTIRPGQPKNLHVVKQGLGWLVLKWDAPTDGGVPRSYKVMRRSVPNSNWEQAAEVIGVTEATLVEQPCDVKLEYCIIGMNKAGESKTGNEVKINSLA